MPEELNQEVATQVEAAIVPEKVVDESPKVSPEIQAELDRLEAKRLELEKVAKEAEEKAIYWRKQKAEARAEFFKGDKGREEPPRPKETPPDIGPVPRKEDFDDYDKYMEAVVDYRTQTKIAQWKKSEEEKGQQTEFQKKIEGLYDKLNRGYEKYPDFEEIARDPSVPITPVVRDILAESETPEDIAYYLGKNRTEAIRLSRMTPFAAAKEIGRIEMEIKKNQPTNEVNVTKSPPPIKPLGSGETTAKDPEKMTQKEYEDWARSRGMKPF